VPPPRNAPDAQQGRHGLSEPPSGRIAPADARIGYLGLGNMGGPLARRLQQSVPLQVHDLSEAAVERLCALGATPQRNAADLARHCDTILLCLPTTAHVRQAIFGPDGIATTARPGTMILDQTTGDPVASRTIAEELRPRGIEMIDAPVSGGPEGAEAGTIAILVGATETQFARAAPVLRGISPNVIHAGDFGCGYVAKLANNLLFAATRLMTLEAVALAAKNGVAPRRMVEIMMKGSSRNFFMEHAMVPRILSGQLDGGFSLALLHKDVRIATQLGLSSEVPLLLGNLVREFYQLCIAEVGSDAPANAAALVIDRIAGTQIVPGKREG
jgi:3-hydroxyisobutyrate dehydrogenase